MKYIQVERSVGWAESGNGSDQNTSSSRFQKADLVAFPEESRAAFPAAFPEAFPAAFPTAFPTAFPAAFPTAFPDASRAASQLAYVGSNSTI